MILGPGLKAVSKSSFSVCCSSKDRLLGDGLRGGGGGGGGLLLKIRSPRVLGHAASLECKKCAPRFSGVERGADSWKSSRASFRICYVLPFHSQSASASSRTAFRGDNCTDSARRFSLFATPMQQPGADEGSAPPGESCGEDVVVQYIVIRKDLTSEWPLGSVITQGCHAAVAAIWLQKDDPITLTYCAPENLDRMHKVTLEVKGEIQLRNLAQKLEAEGVIHKLWIEQPENYATCLATKPYHKSEIAVHFKKLKLCK